MTRSVQAIVTVAGKRAAGVLGAALFATMLAAPPAAVGDDYSGSVAVSPWGNHPGDANVPDAGNVVSGSSDYVMSPHPGYDGTAYGHDPAYGYPRAHGGTAVVPGTVMLEPPYDGGYANVPDTGNVVNGPNWIVR